MTWLAEAAGGPDDSWSALRELNPEGVDALLDLQREVWRHVDPVLLELCRVRIAQLLGAEQHAALRSPAARAAGCTEELLAVLPQWPGSPAYGPRERACLELAEQFVIDVNGLRDDHVAAVLAHLGTAECYALVVALWVFEQFQRFCLVLDLPPAPALLEAR